MRQIITPDNKDHWLSLRAQDITSTEVSALFGFSPYMTAFELWHRKRNQNIVEIEENERMKWGIRLQDSIATGIAEEKSWDVRRMDEYIREESLRIGSSFDFSIEELPGRSEKGLLEIKNVDGLIFKQQWTEDEDGLIEAPLHIEIQVQHQLLVSDRNYAYIGALVGGNKLVLLERQRNDKVCSAIISKVKEFWKSIEDGAEPSPDLAKDASFMCSLYGYADAGKVVDISGDKELLNKAIEYRRLGEQVKEAEGRRKEIKAELLKVISDAEKAIGGQFTISAGMVGPAHIEYDREGYRAFRISWKKEK